MTKAKCTLESGVTGPIIPPAGLYPGILWPRPICTSGYITAYTGAFIGVHYSLSILAYSSSPILLILIQIDTRDLCLKASIVHVDKLNYTSGRSNVLWQLSNPRSDEGACPLLHT